MDSLDEFQPQFDVAWQLSSWVILEYESYVNKERLYQLLVVYERDGPEATLYKLNVFSQKLSLNFVLIEGNSFIWCPNKKNTQVLSLDDYLADINHIYKLADYIGKLRTERHYVNVVQKDQIPDYSTIPSQRYWRAYVVFLQNIAPMWRLSAKQAALLVTGQSNMWPLSEDDFNNYFTAAHRDRLHLLLLIQSNLEKFYGKDRKEILQWLNTKHINFGNVSAFNLMASEEAGILIVHQNTSFLLKK
ncbi:hypothetical protein [Paraglaciecola sp.]|uniref:hypothetical protein n=1 Tax=Paraglaciecola sp. TaxID=1920173 RepID=UPI00273EF6B6|nr:hypothetical protein [Paraglaciecola sp.]MDP5031796.1 hypothetical protein [Paraglaciecola sp.]